MMLKIPKGLIMKRYEKSRAVCSNMSAYVRYSGLSAPWQISEPKLIGKTKNREIIKIGIIHAAAAYSPPTALSTGGMKIAISEERNMERRNQFFHWLSTMSLVSSFLLLLKASDTAGVIVNEMEITRAMPSAME